MARDYAVVFLRSFIQVTLVAANVAQIAAGRYPGAFLVGSAISYVWFLNARSAGRSDLPGAAFVYAFGAGCGTITGMALSHWVR